MPGLPSLALLFAVAAQARHPRRRSTPLRSLVCPSRGHADSSCSPTARAQAQFFAGLGSMRPICSAPGMSCAVRVPWCLPAGLRCSSLNARKACRVRVAPLTRARAPSSVCSQLFLLSCCIDCAAAAGGGGEAPPQVDFAAAAGVALAAAGAVTVGAGGYVGVWVLGAREFSFCACVRCLPLCLGQRMWARFFFCIRGASAPPCSLEEAEEDSAAPPLPHAVWRRQRKTRWTRTTRTLTVRT